MEEYLTLSGEGTQEFVERKSRFIGYVKPVETEQQAQEFIAQIKQKHWDATHNVSAYVLRSGQKRYSDDGEPQGTAGIPVLEVLQKEGITDAAAVVTRYFGGVLLGAGGLVRAYSHGAKIALDAAGIIVMSPCTEVELEFGYDFYGKISYLLPRFYAKTTFSDFGVVVKMRLLLKDKFLDPFQKEISELTSAQVSIREIDRRYDCIEET